MSSFYDLASLVVVPSGYKSGKIYAQKPLSTDGELTFSRGSDIEATRVAANGYIQKAAVNLLLQSNTFDTTWVNTNSAETGGQSGYDGTNNAWLLEKSAAFGRIQQSVTSTSGVKTFSVYLKAGTLSWCRVLVVSAVSPEFYINLADGSIGSQYDNITATSTSVGGGWYRASLIFDDTISEVRIYPAEANNDVNGTSGNIYIQDAQLNYGLVAQDYVETTTTSVVSGITNDMPRLDYSGGASCPSLFLEPSRTNAYTTEYFGGSDWTKTNSSIVDNSTISPEGVQNAHKLVENATTSQHHIGQSFTATSGQAVTFSIFAKAAERSVLQTVISSAYLSTSGYVNFDLSAGSVSASGGGTTGKIEDYGSGWFRCSATFTATASASGTSAFFIQSSPTATRAVSYLGDGTSGIYLYGAQAEANASFESSYIPCYGTSATRTADVSYALNQYNNIGQTEGTIYAEFFLPNNIASGEHRFSLSDNTLNNWFFVSLPESGNKTRMYLRVGSSTAVDVQTGTAVFNYGEVNKVAMAYKSGDSRVYVNGVSVFSSTNSFGTPTSELDVFVITGASGTGSASTQNISNKIKQALLFKTRLSNADLATLTA